MAIGGILTAMVTPFDGGGGLAEDVAARLMRDLLEHGSDGLVLAGTTGESPTLSDAEKVRLWEIGVEACGSDGLVIAGTGSNDTHHSVELTKKACEVGVGAVLAVCPYYNKPNARGLIEHYRAIAEASSVPVILYNIPSRCVIDMSNDLLAELAQIPGIEAVKQARYEDCRPIEGLDLLAGNDDMLAGVLDMGGSGGILVASHIVGEEMRRMIDEPDARGEIHESLRGIFEALAVAPNPIPIKAALNMVGQDVGGLRLPLVEASDGEKDAIRAALERHGLPSGSGLAMQHTNVAVQDLTP